MEGAEVSAGFTATAGHGAHLQHCVFVPSLTDGFLS